MNRRLILAAVGGAAGVIGAVEWLRQRRRPYLAPMPWTDVELLICHDDGELIAADSDDAADLVETGHWSYF